MMIKLFCVVQDGSCKPIVTMKHWRGDQYYQGTTFFFHVVMIEMIKTVTCLVMIVLHNTAVVAI